MATAATEDSSQRIEEFVADLYNYIWAKHKFYNPSLDKKFAEALSLRLLEPEEAKNSPFTEEIGKNVLTAQYLLREFCLDIFRLFETHMLHCKKCFIYCVNLTIHIVAEYRPDICLRFIDLCAIVAEAFLFSDYKRRQLLKIHQVNEMIISLFEVKLSTEFFEDGGWEALDFQVTQHNRIYPFLSKYIKACKHPYVPLQFDCELITFLRDSLTPFPVHISWFCKKCYLISDRDYCHTFRSEMTIEDLIKRYDLLPPPWEKKDCDKASAQEVSVGAESGPSRERDMTYIFLGIDEETAKELLGESDEEDEETEDVEKYIASIKEGVSADVVSEMKKKKKPKKKRKNKKVNKPATLEKQECDDGSAQEASVEAESGPSGEREKTMEWLEGKTMKEAQKMVSDYLAGLMKEKKPKKKRKNKANKRGSEGSTQPASEGSKEM